MKADEFDDFAEVLSGFAEIKGKQLSAPAIEIYWRAMQHWPLQDFRRAAEHLLRTCAFMPMPKDFEDLRRAHRQTEGEAWQHALQHCASGAWRKSSHTAYPEVDTVIEMLGGYETVALCPQDKLTFLERRFCEHYAALQDHEEARTALPHLASEGATPRIGKPLPAAELLKALK